jgi:PTH1 family peptidyl-tRNA hydrolase
MELLVGLGNPGDEYKNTRHNIGWIVLYDFIEQAHFPHPHTSSVFSGEVSVGSMNGREVRVLFPTTMMNNSGKAVKKALECDIAEHVIVVHDEVDLPFGTIRIAESRGAGGHNGVKSIIESIGSSDFIRIRIGVAKKNIFGIVRRPVGDKLPDFVLSEFSLKEQKQLPEIQKKVARALELIYTKGVKDAMTTVNAG